MAEIDQYLMKMVEAGASDLHLASVSPPLVRVNGELKLLEGPPLPPKDLHRMVGEILDERQRKTFKERRDIDFAYQIPEVGRFRGNAYVHFRGMDAVFRYIPSRIPRLEELGFPAVVEQFGAYRRGLVLVTGPAGCGKTTTQAALLDLINERRHEHIITVEDPIEFEHKDKTCLVNQREVGYNTRSFSVALRAALRQDPDIILVGEMRDLETISMALTASETGHLVIGTLHTINAQHTVDRIIDVFPGDQRLQIRVMVAESLVGVISQQLIPTLDGKGRVAAYEILVGTVPITSLIREGKTFQIRSMMQMGRAKGMVLLDDCLLQLFRSKKISFQTGLAYAKDKEEFERQARAGVKEKQAPAAGR
jgi:twitching motility protein PilT